MLLLVHATTWAAWAAARGGGGGLQADPLADKLRSLLQPEIEKLSAQFNDSAIAVGFRNGNTSFSVAAGNARRANAGLPAAKAGACRRWKRLLFKALCSTIQSALQHPIRRFASDLWICHGAA